VADAIKVCIVKGMAITILFVGFWVYVASIIVWGPFNLVAMAFRYIGEKVEDMMSNLSDIIYDR
jgi:hypothetical protein